MFSKIFAVSLIAASSLLSFASNTVQASAAVDYIRIVTASNGLNVRDENCNKINTIGKGTIINADQTPSQPKITCKINGTNVTFSYVMYNTGSADGISDGNAYGYVALAYTQPILFNENLDITKTMYVNATSGLNLRSYMCKRMGVVAHATSFSAAPTEPPFPVCERDGKYYLMFPVTYNNQYYWVASYYLTINLQ